MASVHTMKGNTNAPNPHVGGSDAGMPKGGDRNKRVVPNKRVRTSMADTRVCLIVYLVMVIECVVDKKKL